MKNDLINKSTQVSKRSKSLASLNYSNNESIKNKEMNTTVINESNPTVRKRIQSGN